MLMIIIIIIIITNTTYIIRIITLVYVNLSLTRPLIKRFVKILLAIYTSPLKKIAKMLNVNSRPWCLVINTPMSFVILLIWKFHSDTSLNFHGGHHNNGTAVSPHQAHINQTIYINGTYTKPLRWRHNGRDGVSNHQPHDCLLKSLFGRR